VAIEFAEFEVSLLPGYLPRRPAKFPTHFHWRRDVITEFYEFNYGARKMSDNESYTTEDFWEDLDWDDQVDLPVDPSGCPGGNPEPDEKPHPHCRRMRALIRAIYMENN
jgi:hypothetical protein